MHQREGETDFLSHNPKGKNQHTKRFLLIVGWLVISSLPKASYIDLVLQFDFVHLFIFENEQKSIRVAKSILSSAEYNPAP